MEKDGFVTDIEKETNENTNFRKVLFTGKHSQLVVMSLKPKEEIGMEKHHVDQFFRIETSHGRAIINGKEHKIKAGSGIVVPANVNHNIINTSKHHEMKLYTIYSPPQHKDGEINKVKPKED